MWHFIYWLRYLAVFFEYWTYSEKAIFIIVVAIMVYVSGNVLKRLAFKTPSLGLGITLYKNLTKVPDESFTTQSAPKLGKAIPAWDMRYGIPLRAATYCVNSMAWAFEKCSVRTKSRLNKRQLIRIGKIMISKSIHIVFFYCFASHITPASAARRRRVGWRGFSPGTNWKHLLCVSVKLEARILIVFFQFQDTFYSQIQILQSHFFYKTE